MKPTVGTRGSKLALKQTHLVLEMLGLRDVEVRKIKTKGDKVKTALSGGIGFFVKEVNEAVERGEVDFAVHSMKDLPMEIPSGLGLITTKRESPYDALASGYGSIDELPYNARVGTSSFRRKAELKRLRDDLDICELRGNLDTRLRRLDEGDFDAVIVAEAGLVRLGMADRITKRLSEDEIMPPAGQGALGITVRKDDKETLKILSPIEDKETKIEVSAERGFLKRLRGGCQIPAGVLARIDGNEIKISGMISSLDGKKSIRGGLDGKVSEANGIGTQLAEMLLDKGGKEILEEIGG